MCVLAVLAHPQRQRLDAAQDEPRVERAGHRAERVLQELQPLGDRRVVRADEAADDVGVAADVLRRRVDDDVGAVLERALQVRRGEGVVDDEDRADGVRGVGGRADVDHVQRRVRRRLDPDHPRPLVEVRGEVRVELVGRDVVEVIALRPVDARRHAVDAAVDVRDQHDPVAGVEQVHQRRRRAEPGRVADAVVSALERGEALLERLPRRVRRARVVEALVLDRPPPARRSTSGRSGSSPRRSRNRAPALRGSHASRSPCPHRTEADR